MIRKVVVAGGGVLGSQIAFQSAYCGFDVTIWLRSESSIGRTQPKLDHLHQVYIDTINLMATPDGQTPANWANGIADFDGFDPKKCLEKVEAAYKNTHLELDMAKAVADADLVIESMAENVEDKISFYQKLAPLMPAKTVLVTNSSTLLPSKFAKYTGRPDEYLSLHFANSIWKNNIAEIMAQSKTEGFRHGNAVCQRHPHDCAARPQGKIRLSAQLDACAAAVLGDGLVRQRHFRPGEHRQGMDAGHGRAEGTISHSGHRRADDGTQHRQNVPEDSVIPRAV